MTPLMLFLAAASAAPAPTPSTGAAAPERPTVTVTVVGPAAAAQRIDAALSASPELARFHPAELPRARSPQPSPAPASPAAPSLPEARQAYVKADFARCLASLGGADAAAEALGAGDALAASRLLLWRAACHLGDGDQRAARDAAEAMVVLGLPAPADVGSVSPEVEALLARVRAAPHPEVPVRLEASVSGAELVIDGRPQRCATPCTVPLAEGAHVVRAEADGYETLVRRITAAAPSVQVRLELTPASPEVAAAQWSARYAGRAEPDAARSVRLLSTALRAPRLLLFSVDDGRTLRLRTALAVDGEVAARAERIDVEPRELEAAARGLASDVLVRGRVLERAPALHQRPEFWIAVGVAAVIAAGTTALVASRSVRTGIGL
ncbi:MAG TPA: PEGA domain-containing protein [Myxococcales bacterium]|nr:PEGA domain-containing protein [Myxococcales bacterium]